jgi:hypothetical protein
MGCCGVAVPLTVSMMDTSIFSRRSTWLVGLSFLASLRGGERQGDGVNIAADGRLQRFRCWPRG